MHGDENSRLLFLSNATKSTGTIEFSYTKVIVDLEKNIFRGGLIGVGWVEKTKIENIDNSSVGFDIKGSENIY